ncbi:MAG: hypothetical protein ACLRQF_14745 [Thomasclavelia ramosa]
MAPYMMSVGLYVAAMAFTLMYPLFNDVEKAESGFKYWLSKASICLLFQHCSILWCH